MSVATASDNRIDRRLADCRANARVALVPFVTAGDPHPEHVVALLHGLVAAGADMIELGLPFSDPMADGPTIQRSSERAVARGVDIPTVFAWVREFRLDDADTPLVLMGYLNPIEHYGHRAFASDAAAAGIDGVLTVDCPVEEADTLEALRDAGLRRIWMTAPTTSADRLARIAELAEGFLYHVSVAGTTGAAAVSADAVKARVAELRALTRMPVAVGFGVKDAQSAAAIAEIADAVVIGSALVARLADSADAEETVRLATEFLHPLRVAIDKQGGQA